MEEWGTVFGGANLHGMCGKDVTRPWRWLKQWSRGVDGEGDGWKEIAGDNDLSRSREPVEACMKRYSWRMKEVGEITREGDRVAELEELKKKQGRSSPILSRYDYNMVPISLLHIILSYLLHILGSF